jgi:hypothetical protein
VSGDWLLAAGCWLLAHRRGLKPAVLGPLAAGCWLLAAGCDAAESARVVRGPWWWHGTDGSPHVAVAVAGVPAVPASGNLDGRDCPLTSSIVPFASAGDGANQVVVLHLAAGSHGALRFDLAGQQITARLRLPPAADAPARIALASGRAWPDRAALATLGKALGGEPQLVLALGPDVPVRLGSGGWEAEVPIVVVAPPDPALESCTDSAATAWRHGLRVGLLGLPASPDRGRADLALARDLSPWLAYLDAPAGWDPAIGQSHASDSRDLGVLLAACQRLKVPLVLGAGRAGLVSEPLTMQEGGSVVVATGGVRYVLPVPADDDGLGRLPAAAALALEQPLLAGLSATLAELRLVLLRPGDADAVQLVWRRTEEPPEPVATLVRSVVNAESLETPAVRQAILAWTWLTRRELSANMPSAEQIARLRDEGGAQGRALARRLALIAAEDPSIAAIPGDADPLAARDLLLWRLATVRGAEAASWRSQAAAATDPLLLRALLADLARDPAHTVLPVLVERLTLQAAGTLPLDPDPIDQHRLCAAVFDDVRLSPTPLRPLAVKLRDLVTPLARGPIDRFIARHGEMRPVP